MQRTRRMRLSITSPPPWLPLKKKTSNISPVKKKTTPPPLFLFPATLSHPISTTAPLPAPGFCCTNQEQMSAGAVLKDPAVLDASHMLFIQRWRLTARLLVKPISKKEREREREREVEKNKLSKCLQVPSKGVHIWAHLFVSSLQAPHQWQALFFWVCVSFVSEAGGEKWRDVVDKNISWKGPSSAPRQLVATHKSKLKKKWPQFETCGCVLKNKMSFRVAAPWLHRYPGLRSKSNTAHSKLTWWLEDIPECPAAEASKHNIHFEHRRQMRIFI